MELRHLRCFVALAEELHFTRAAERLHIEQSPLSRTIKELEEKLSTPLFVRNRRATRLTAAGEVLLNDVRLILSMLDQAKKNVRSVASGYRGILRIAISDGAIEPRLSALLARCRAEEPELEVRMSEMSLSAQLRGLRNGHFDVGFARSSHVGSDIVAEPVGIDPLLAAIPLGHPLAACPHVPLTELIRYPLIVCDPQLREGCSQQLNLLLRSQGTEPIIAEYAGSLEMMLALVAVGYGVGFVTDAQKGACIHPTVVLRPIDASEATMTTYLLRLASNESELVQRFIARLQDQPPQQSEAPNVIL
ncbi:MAG: LysR family transcriptional regulator [Pigmentiphaga sp.]|uniref:LysR family transcriptional regulator n=1 Tax=Pigmentiphaga sp. TaxID=1977564 RepID=UPI003B545F92